MPIYGYQCSACGHQKDVLQKLSDPVLTTCPQCQEDAFGRQVSAPAFQLKGTGWYVTDFRDGKKSDDKASNADSGEASSSTKSADGGSETKSGSDTKASSDSPAKSASKTESAVSKPASASSPAPASGGSSSS